VNGTLLQILERHRVRPTPMRMLVLEQMLLHGRGASLNELEILLVQSDRITIYRTLKTFESHGIVHSVESANRGTIYALCDGACTPEGHEDSHPHFFCESCGKTDCTGDFPYEIVMTPEAGRNRVHRIEVIIRGICPECTAKKG
jgi:Fur family transcriptional regulator, ferric uptake regulator